MPPTVITVRHAQGHHNVDNKFYIRDATLTPIGHQQCADLAKSFPYHDKVDLLVASPLRRTVSTAVESFYPILSKRKGGTSEQRQNVDGQRQEGAGGPTTSEDGGVSGSPSLSTPQPTSPNTSTSTTTTASPLSTGTSTPATTSSNTSTSASGEFVVPFILHPLAQEVSERRCNIGWEREELHDIYRPELSTTLVDQTGIFEDGRMDDSLVVKGWCSKVGYWSPEPSDVQKRAADLRSWLYERSEKLIVLVTHGAFLHYFTNNFGDYDPGVGSGYGNCEVREFTFTDESTREDAQIVETKWSLQQRGEAAGEDAQGSDSEKAVRDLAGKVQAIGLSEGEKVKSLI